MRKGTFKDRKRVVEIISRSFENNPGINWIFRKNVNHRKAMKRIARWAFIKSLMREGVFLSDNEKGVAFCFRHDYKVFSILEFTHLFWFGITCIKWTRIGRVLRHEAYRESIRPSSGKYLYFWFFGVLPEGREAAFDLKDGIMNISREQQLPVYVETTVERNVLVYQRYGFKTYFINDNREEGLKMWFMKFEPGEHPANHR